MHQLLPSYACIQHADGLRTLTETTLPDLDTPMMTDAMAFHRDLAVAEAARPASLAMTHAIVGTRQPTPTTLDLTTLDRAHGRPQVAELVDTIGGDSDYGDGTVPLAGAIGHNLPMDTNTIRRIVDQHGHLQDNPHALDELEDVLAATPVRRRAPTTVPVLLRVPDLVIAGQPLPITATIDTGIQITVTTERNRVVFARRPAVTHHEARLTVPALPPGAYQIAVTGANPRTPVTPVTAQLLV